MTVSRNAAAAAPEASHQYEEPTERAELHIYLYPASFTDSGSMARAAWRRWSHLWRHIARVTLRIPA